MFENSKKLDNGYTVRFHPVEGDQVLASVVAPNFEPLDPLDFTSIEEQSGGWDDKRYMSYEQAADLIVRTRQLPSLKGID